MNIKITVSDTRSRDYFYTINKIIISRFAEKFITLWQLQNVAKKSAFLDIFLQYL